MEYWSDLYLELSHKITGLFVVKNNVSTFNDLAITYPNPKNLWASKVIDTGYIYLFQDGIWNNTLLKEFYLNEIKWCDLWHEQVSFLTAELPFPTPAIFISFKMLSGDDKGLKGQICNTQIDFRLFYETFSDTYSGSINQTTAIKFLKQLTNIHKLFHGTSGTNYSEMRRVDMTDEDSGGAGNLYRISFQCIVDDMSAMIEYNDTDVEDISIERGSKTEAPVDTSMFIVET
jgi:hypothetical protein